MLGAFLLFGVEYITFLIVPYKQKARKPLPALRATGVYWILACRNWHYYWHISAKKQTFLVKAY